VVPGYARHWETGELLDPEVIETLRDAQGFGQGFETLEYLAAAMLDLGWHALEDGDAIEDVLSFEAEVLSAAGFDPVVPPRYRSTYFAHTFTGGYASGYYSYLWSEQYAAAVSELFEDHGGLDPELGARYRKEVLALGFSVDPLTALRDFLGAEVEVDPLLRRRGLAPLRPAGPAHPAHARLERDLRAAGIDARVVVHPEPLPTAAAAAQHHGVDVGAIANSLVFLAEFEEETTDAEAGETSAHALAGDDDDGRATTASAEDDPQPAAPQVREEPVLIMTSGAHRVDTEHTAAVIGARRLKRATPEAVLEATGQPVGGVAPAGHPAQLLTFIDRDLRQHAQLWAGGGTVEAMVPLTYTQLVDLTGGKEIDVEPN
jgi:peptidyl-dipeptidase Dcp